MSEPVVNPASRVILDAIIDKLPQSLLVTGESGIGLSTIAKLIAKKLEITPIIILPEKDEKVDLDKGIISVEIMRRIYNDTRIKSTEQRIIIIDYAERMTVQSQNAFLKLLEEPGEGVHFILVSNTISKLLPTVVSRVEVFDVKPISDKQSAALLDTLGVTDAKKRSQLLFMASGLPAELSRLVTDDAYFDARSGIIRDARDILQGKLYNRLLIAQKYKDDRASALLLLSDAGKILKHSITDKPQPSSIARIESLLQASQRIEANGNIRLSLAVMSI